MTPQEPRHRLTIALKGYVPSFPDDSVKLDCCDLIGSVIKIAVNLSDNPPQQLTGRGRRQKKFKKALDVIRYSTGVVKVYVTDLEMSIRNGSTSALEQLLSVPNLQCFAWISIGGYRRLHKSHKGLARSFKPVPRPLEEHDTWAGGFPEILEATKNVRKHYNLANCELDPDCCKAVAEALAEITDDLMPEYGQIIRPLVNPKKSVRYQTKDPRFEDLVRIGLVRNGQFASKALETALEKTDFVWWFKRWVRKEKRVLECKQLLQLAVQLIMVFAPLLFLKEMWERYQKPQSWFTPYAGGMSFVFFILSIRHVGWGGGKWKLRYLAVNFNMIVWFLLVASFLTFSVLDILETNSSPPLRIEVQYPDWLFNRDQGEIRLKLLDEGPCPKDGGVQIDICGIEADPNEARLGLNQPEVIKIQTGESGEFRPKEISLKVHCEKYSDELSLPKLIKVKPFPFGVRQTTVAKFTLTGLWGLAIAGWNTFVTIRSKITEPKGNGIILAASAVIILVILLL